MRGGLGVGLQRRGDLDEERVQVDDREDDENRVAGKLLGADSLVASSADVGRGVLQADGCGRHGVGPVPRLFCIRLATPRALLIRPGVLSSRMSRRCPQVISTMMRKTMKAIAAPE